MGLSENSVPLNPMVLLIIIPMKNGYFIGNIPNIFRQTHMAQAGLVRSSHTDPLDLLEIFRQGTTWSRKGFGEKPRLGTSLFDKRRARSAFARWFSACNSYGHWRKRQGLKPCGFSTLKLAFLSNHQILGRKTCLSSLCSRSIQTYPWNSKGVGQRLPASRNLESIGFNLGMPGDAPANHVTYWSVQNRPDWPSTWRTYGFVWK